MDPESGEEGAVQTIRNSGYTKEDLPEAVGHHLSISELFDAASNDDAEEVCRLLQELQPTLRRQLLTFRDEDLWTPLHIVANNGHLEMLDAILQVEEAAKLMMMQTITGDTPLHICCSLGHVALVKRMLELVKSELASDFLTRQNKNNETPLHCAAYVGELEICEILCHTAGDNCAELLGILAKGGLTALHYAAMESHGDVFKILLSFGADVKAVDFMGRYAFDLLPDDVKVDLQDQKALREAENLCEEDKCLFIAERLRSMGNDLVKANDYKSALVAYHRALRLYSGNVDQKENSDEMLQILEDVKRKEVLAMSYEVEARIAMLSETTNEAKPFPGKLTRKAMCELDNPDQKLKAMYENFKISEDGEDKNCAILCLSNCGHCHLQRREDALCIAACDAALRLDHAHVKSLYRRSCALLRLEDFDLAKRDVQRLADLAPGDRKVKSLLSRLRKHSDKVFTGIFGDNRDNLQTMDYLGDDRDNRDNLQEMGCLGDNPDSPQTMDCDGDNRDDLQAMD